MLEPGHKAPAFTLPDQNGEKVRLSDFKGPWLLLYLTQRSTAVKVCLVEPAHRR